MPGKAWNRSNPVSCLSTGSSRCIGEVTERGCLLNTLIAAEWKKQGCLSRNFCVLLVHLFQHSKMSNTCPLVIKQRSTACRARKANHPKSKSSEPANQVLCRYHKTDKMSFRISFVPFPSPPLSPQTHLAFWGPYMFFYSERWPNKSPTTILVQSQIPLDDSCPRGRL